MRSAFKRLAIAFLLVLAGVSLAHADRKTTYYHTDALGSVVAASDDTGALLWRKEYAPFGVQLDSTTENEKRSFTGKEYDEATGLTYFGARYYDPYLGRFMGIDPAGINPNDPFTFNRYTYGNNNPYRFIDPNGRQSEDASCDEVCEELLARAQRASGAREVAEKASQIGDAIDEEATSAENWVPYGRVLKKLSKILPKKLRGKGIPAGQRVNMPAWKKIEIDMHEVRSGHMAGGSRLAPDHKKDLFPEDMTEAQVESAIRNAYRYGEVLQSQGADRVFVRGPFGDRTIEMWVNKATKTIETAYPK